MTDQPPPPPGNYPPPPPPPPPPGGYPPPPGPQAGGYPPSPPPGGGYQAPQVADGGFRAPGVGYQAPQVADLGFLGAPGGALPQEAYTPWFTRVLAWIIDYVPVFIIMGIGVAVLAGTRETVCITDTSEFDLGEFCDTGASTLGQMSFFLIAPLIALAYVAWNLGYRQGTTGSSIGKSIMKFKLVSEKTGQPIGFGMSFVRELVYLAVYFACGIIWLVAVLFPLWDPKRQSLADKIFTTICVPL
jgi:uncharacterized RDD family membrane protein YckC